MAEQYVKVRARDETLVLVEVTPSDGMFQAGASDLIQQAEHAFEVARKTIQACAHEFITTIDALPDSIRAQEITLEFGINLKAELGAAVAKASGDANFKVSMKWVESQRARGSSARN